MNEDKTITMKMKRIEETKPKKVQVVKVKAIPIRMLMKSTEGDDMFSTRIEPRRAKIDLMKCLKSTITGDHEGENDDQFERRMNEYSNSDRDDSEENDSFNAFDRYERHHSNDLHASFHQFNSYEMLDDDIEDVFEPEDHLHLM